jgi:membrane-associated phospholipid phosphatase
MNLVFRKTGVPFCATPPLADPNMPDKDVMAALVSRVGLAIPWAMRLVLYSVPALTAAIILFAAPAARAEEEASPFALHTEVELTVLLSSSAVWALPVLFEDVLAPGSCQPCNPGEVNAFDRTAIGFHDEAADAASDIGAVGLPLLAAMGSFIEVEPFGWSAALEDAVLVAEAVSISGAVNQAVKNVALRPRPYMYVAGTAEDEGRARDNYRSFYSSHTSTAFAASVAFAYIFSVRRPDSPWRYAVWGIAIAAASAVGVCRVLAGEHFWTDAIAGAIAGSAFGLLTPALHLRGERATREKGPEVRAVAGPGAASLYVRF